MSNRSKGIILSYLTVIVKNLSLLLYTQILLRFLGKSEYGLYQIANSVISNLTLLNLGFSFSYIKFYTGFVVKNEEKRIQKLNGTYLLFFTIISLLAGVIGGILVHNSPYFLSSSSIEEQTKLKNLMLFMILNVVLTFLSATFESNILANERFVFQQIRQMFQSACLPLITVPVLYFFHTDIVTIVIIQTMITLVSLLCNVFFCIQKLRMRITFRQLEFSFMKEIGIFSFFIFLNQLFNQINDSAPVFTLGVLANTRQVAIYSIVNQLKALFLTFSQVLTTIFIPKVNRLVHQSNDDRELTHLMIKIGQYQLLVLGLFLGGFILLGKMFLFLWLGKGFDEAYYLLISIVIPLLIPLSQNIAIEIQQARNQYFFRSIMLMIFACLNIVITIVCVKQAGINGATIGYIFSLIVGYGFVMNWYYHKKMNLNMLLFWKKMLPAIIPSILAVFISKLLLTIFPISNIPIFLFMGIVYCSIYGCSVFLLMPHVFQQFLGLLTKKEKRHQQ